MCTSFPYQFLLSNHKCTTISSVVCNQCGLLFNSQVNLDDHINERHFKCAECPHVASTQKDLRCHIQVQHQKININIVREKVIECAHCDYKCTYNIQLKKHIERKHTIPEKKSLIKCDGCDFSHYELEEVWHHRTVMHNKTQDLHVAVACIAEQNFEIVKEIETLKKHIKGAFIDFADVLEKHLDNMKEDLKTSIDAKPVSSSKSDQEVVPATKIECSAAQEHNEKTSVSAKVESNSKLNLLWVGESVETVLDVKKLEKDCNLNLHTSVAHGITDEKWGPTFQTIVPTMVKKSKADVLVVQAGSKEITDIGVNEALVDPKKDIEAYKQDWFKLVEQDSQDIFHIAQKATKADPGLKVIIAKRTKRYDRSSCDLLKIKSHLSEFANATLDQLWAKAGQPSNINIVDIDLLTDQYPHLRELVFGSLNSPSYDGVQMIGTGACRQFTYRAKQVLKLFLQKKFGTEKNPSLKPYPVRRQQVSINRSENSRSMQYNIPTMNRFSPLNCQNVQQCV